MKDDSTNDPLKSPIVRFGMRFFGVLLIVLSPFAIYQGISGYLDGRDSPNWPRVIGEVYNQEVFETTRKGKKIYSVYINYRYTVNGKQYTGSNVSPFSGSVDAQERDRLLAAYPIGNTPEIAYAPSDPERAFLEPGQPPQAIFKVIVPWVFPVIGIGLLVFSRKPRAFDTIETVKETDRRPPIT